MAAGYDLDNMGGLVGEILRDTREFEDPWGWGIKGIVTRGDSPEWRQYKLERAADKPDAQKIRLAAAENAFVDMRPDGFRHGKKLSKSEAYQRMVNKVAEKGEVVIDIFELREEKPGIAEILCPSLTFKGETLVRWRGQEYDLTTAAGRLAFLNHDLWQFEEGENGSKVTKNRTIPVYKTGANGEPEVDGFGEPVENLLGGWNIGDAIAQLIVNESKDLAAFVEKRGKAVLEPSGAGVTGNSATGSSFQSASDES